MEVDMQKKELPKAEWTKPEDDVPYLRPYIMWTQFEFEELDAQRILREDIPVIPFQLVTPDDFDSGKVYTRRYVD